MPNSDSNPTTSSTASVPFALSAMGANSGPPRASSSSSCFAAICARSTGTSADGPGEEAPLKESVRGGLSRGGKP